MPQAKIGVIGGTGLYQIEGMTDIEEINLDTPFGKPSDSLIIGKLNGCKHRLLAPPWPRPSHPARRSPLPCQYLCSEIPGCGAYHGHQFLRQF